MEYLNTFMRSGIKGKNIQCSVVKTRDLVSTKEINKFSNDSLIGKVFGYFFW